MSLNRKIESDPFVALNVALAAREDLNFFVEISLEGFSYAQNAKEVVTILNRKKSEDTGNDLIFQSQIEHAESLEKFAKVHGESEFSYLYCLASLRLWSILETFVKDLCHDMLLVFPELHSLEALKELKGPLLTFLMSSQSEQAAVILRLLEKELGGPRQVGIARFESLLEQFGLGGAVSPLIKRTLLELWGVRNVVAHRNGVADSRFMDTCPWLDASLRKQLIVSNRHFRRYDLASAW